jgi:hypothetical protein
LAIKIEQKKSGFFQFSLFFSLHSFFAILNQLIVTQDSRIVILGSYTQTGDLSPLNHVNHVNHVKKMSAENLKLFQFIWVSD